MKKKHQAGVVIENAYSVDVESPPPPPPPPPHVRVSIQSGGNSCGLIRFQLDGVSSMPLESVFSEQALGRL